MEVVNPFILKNKERMIVFLDQLSSVSDPNPPPGTYIESSSNNSPDTGKMRKNALRLEHLPMFHGLGRAPFIWLKCNTLVRQFPKFMPNFITFSMLAGRELATLHHICVSYLPELQRIGKTSASIKKLVTVTDMLTKHKLKYREMIS